MNLKERIIDKIIEIEGGYSNDPADSGGKTRWGIIETEARAYGYTGSMRELPKETARKIYEEKYLKKIRFDAIAALSEKIAAELADTSVNMGWSRAGRFLQESLNVLNRGGRDYPDLTVDGVIGAKTLAALRSYLSKRGKDGEEVLLKMLNALQGAFYVELAKRRVKDEKFVYGWFKNRVGALA